MKPNRLNVGCVKPNSVGEVKPNIEKTWHYSKKDENRSSEIEMNQSESNPENYLQNHIEQFSPDVQEIVTQVLQLEKKKLSQKAPRNINEDVLNIIKDVVQ